MDPLQQLLTQRALASPQMNQATPNDLGSMGQGQAPNQMAPQGPGGAIAGMMGGGQSSPMAGIMGQMNPQMGIGQPPAPPMRLPQAPPQPAQGAGYMPRDSANDRNYV